MLNQILLGGPYHLQASNHRCKKTQAYTKHTSTHIDIHTYTYEHKQGQTYISAHTSTNKHIHKHTSIQISDTSTTFKHIHTHLFIQAYTDKHTHTSTKIPNKKHIDIHMQIHTYKHTRHRYVLVRTNKHMSAYTRTQTKLD